MNVLSGACPGNCKGEGRTNLLFFFKVLDMIVNMPFYNKLIELFPNFSVKITPPPPPGHTSLHFSINMSHHSL